MSIRNLDAIFAPKAIALIGASARPHAIGALTAHNLLSGGFDGPIMPVNPHDASIEGVIAYPDIAKLPVAPDLAVIATPPQTVPGLIVELGQRGTRGAIVITAGFGEAAAGGKALQQEMLDAARPHLMRIVGPNCVGVLSTPHKINASFAQLFPKKGDVAFVAQSGAMVTTVLDWASARGIGFSHLVSLGDMADVDFGDMLDYLALDDSTRAILLYIESITQARKFMSAARAAARVKPVIAIKAGREPGSAKAAHSHTGALAGMDAVYDAAFRRAGILRVKTLDEVFDAVETLATHPPIRTDALTILTNGGGVGVLAADALLGEGGKLAELAPETLQKLDAVLPPTWSQGNPVDIIGDADGARYAAALGALIAAPGDDAILVLNCPTAVASGVEAAKAVVACARGKHRAVLTNWLGAGSAEEARHLFAAANLPTYDTPEKAVTGFMHMVRYRRGQETLMEVPEAAPSDFSADAEGAHGIVREALAASGGGWLDEIQIHKLFSCYGIPSVRSALVSSTEEAAEKAKEFGGAVALKIFSPDITHKSDAGGVRLDLSGADAVRAAGLEMHDRVAHAMPNARLEGFIVQEMIRRPGAYELILGAGTDRQFGPYLLFGQGGTAVEVIADRALALPPLNFKLACEAMAETRIWKLLKGYRDHPPAALAQIATTLVQLSQLICDLDEVVELDINPLLADSSGVIALDARVRVAPAEGPHGSRLSIRPYPGELAHTETIEGIGAVLIRPVKPEDAPAFAAAFKHLSPEDVRLRFLSPLHGLPPEMLARLTQIDYDREMAFVVFRGTELIAVSRLAADPDNRKAEFAIIVRSDLKGRGLGTVLMRELVAYARARGTGEIFGEVLAENARMLALCHDLGCKVELAGDGIVRVSLALN